MRRFGGRVTYRRTGAEVQASNRTLLEFTWNHTTLVALKSDKTLTYIQSAFDPSRHLAQAKALERELAGEVLMHLEFLRNRDGASNCSGLQLIRYTSDERLAEIMQIHRDHGVTINNPHVFIVEEGRQGALDPAVLATKNPLRSAGPAQPREAARLAACSAGGRG